MDDGDYGRYIIDLDNTKADTEPHNIANRDEFGDDYGDYDIVHGNKPEPGHILIDMLRKSKGGQDYDNQGYFEKIERMDPKVFVQVSVKCVK